jgi:hypothetical protein
MPTVKLSALESGYIWGDHDIGMTAWTIRWKSAGWANRDNMAIWSHVGFFYGKEASGGVSIGLCHMLDILTSSPTSIRLGNPGDNPGFTSCLIPWIFCGGAHPNSSFARYYADIAMYNALLKPAKYDYKNVIGQFFGTTMNFSANPEMICTELIWAILTSVERLFGLRMTYGGSELWPVNWTCSQPATYDCASWGYPWSGITRCCFKNHISSNWLTPYNQQTRYNISPTKLNPSLWGGFILPKTSWINP